MKSLSKHIVVISDLIVILLSHCCPFLYYYIDHQVVGYSDTWTDVCWCAVKHLTNKQNKLILYSSLQWYVNIHCSLVDIGICKLNSWVLSVDCVTTAHCPVYNYNVYQCVTRTLSDVGKHPVELYGEWNCSALVIDGRILHYRPAHNRYFNLH